jgi:aspartyl-tRNA(Asn)/glutamyl-tRNA(Gln) amidotransferase subunit A
VVWKDLVDLAGTPTTAGSAIYRDAAPAAEDAVVAANLAAAGMVSIGKVNLTEFAYSGLGLNPHFGTPKNPADGVTPRAPGGSSSGSAVAVAAGVVPIGIGTDTGGSVRVPAAFNGIVGLKTSEGRIDKRGVFPLCDTLDTVGVLARSVEDCALTDAAMRGVTAPLPAPLPARSLRVIVAEDLLDGSVEEDVRRSFEDALERLAGAGVTVQRRTLPPLGGTLENMRQHGTLTAVEAYRVHRALMESPRAGSIDPRVISRIMRAKTMTALDLLEIQIARKQLRAEIETALGEAILVMPTVGHVAPEIAPLDADPELFNTVNLRTLRNTIIGNFLALCGLTLPIAPDRRGLPVGMLFSLPGGQDERLIAAGFTLEKILGPLALEPTRAAAAVG